MKLSIGKRGLRRSRKRGRKGEQAGDPDITPQKKGFGRAAGRLAEEKGGRKPLVVGITRLG